MFKKTVRTALIAVVFVACSPATTPSQPQRLGKYVPTREEEVIFPECVTTVRVSPFLPPFPAGWVASSPDCMQMVHLAKQGKIRTSLFESSVGDIKEELRAALSGFRSTDFGTIESEKDGLTAWIVLSPRDPNKPRVGLCVLRRIPKSTGLPDDTTVIAIGSWPKSAQAELSQDLLDYVRKFPYHQLR